MHEALFQASAHLTPDVIREVTARLGLQSPGFDACVAGDGLRGIRQHVDGASQLGVRGTPTLLLGTTESNGRMRVLERMDGLVSYEALVTRLEAVIHRK
jgi:protein-disulfide isomerase-like protein with CxxC motif